MLASASDDRTLRVWDIPHTASSSSSRDSSSLGSGDAGGGSMVPLAALNGSARPTSAAGTAGAAGAPALLQPRHVLWGHTAHLWDCAWGRGLIVSASEDCSCKFWDLGTGALLATIQVSAP
jgi:WD40 repeat protein